MGAPGAGVGRLQAPVTCQKHSAQDVQELVQSEHLTTPKSHTGTGSRTLEGVAVETLGQGRGLLSKHCGSISFQLGVLPLGVKFGNGNCVRGKPFFGSNQFTLQGTKGA